MTSVRPARVISFSNEDPNQPAGNLTKSGSFRRWRCGKEGETKAWVEFELDRLSIIKGIEVGNNGSAFVEVLVGRTGFQESEYKVLLSNSALMSAADSRNEVHTLTVRRFGSDDLNTSTKSGKWNRVRVVCTQPFNSEIKYGLSLFLLQFAEEPSSTTQNTASSQSQSAVPRLMIGGFRLKDEAELKDDLKTGALFSKFKRKTTSANTSATSASAIRSASQSLAAAALAESEKELADILKENSSSSTNLTPSKSFCAPNKRQLLEELKEKDRKRQKPDNGDSSPLPSRKELPGETSTKPATQKTTTVTEKQTDKHSKKKLDVSSSTSNGHKLGPKTDTAHTDQKKASKHKPKITKPFSRLMEGVTFVISGFQNPLRSHLRDKAVALGARYKADWDKTCTHLICAFFNTPKFRQVKGKGKIVTREWIEQCYATRKRLPWRRSCLDRNDKADESEEEIWAEEEETHSSSSPSTSSATNKPPQVAEDDEDYGGSTDVDEPDTDDEIALIQAKCRKEESRTAKSVPALSDLPLPQLRDIFSEKVFFLYGSFDTDVRQQLERYIVAFNGKIAQYMGPDVKFVVSKKQSWDKSFAEAKAENPQLIFVQPDWIWQCAEKQDWVEYDDYEIKSG